MNTNHPHPFHGQTPDAQSDSRQRRIRVISESAEPEQHQTQLPSNHNDPNPMRIHIVPKQSEPAQQPAYSFQPRQPRHPGASPVEPVPADPVPADPNPYDPAASGVPGPIPAYDPRPDLQQQLDDLNSEIAVKEAAIAGARSSLADLTAHQQALQQQSADLQAEISARENEAARLNTRLEQQKTQVTRIEGLLALSDSELQQVMSRLLERCEQLSASQEETASDLAQDTEQMEDMKSSEFVAQDLLSPLEERYAQLREQLLALQQDLTQISQAAALGADKRSTELNIHKHGSGGN